MKRLSGLITLAMLVIFFPAASTAGEAEAAPTGFDGNRAIQFGVASSFRLEAFQGQLFSYRWFVSDRRALRIAGGLGLDRNDVDLDAERFNGDETGSIELLGWDASITLKAQMAFYHGDGPVFFYWGAGPKLTYLDFRSENANDTSHGGNVEFTVFAIDIDQWGAGAQGFAGVEWFINDMFSLHAEYGVSGMYVRTRRVEERVRTYDPDTYTRYETTTRSPELRSDGVRFGLSATF